jgi:O-antigen ligase
MMPVTATPDLRPRVMPLPLETPPGKMSWVLFAGLCALLVFGPLAFGAVEKWSLLVLQAGASLLFLLWSGRNIFRGTLELDRSPLYVPMAAFALLVAGQLALGFTSYRYDTLTYAVRYITYGMLFLVALDCFRRPGFARYFAVVMTVFGSLLSVFAIVQGFTANGKIYWVRTLRQFAAYYGPYVNHNHYAGLIEMLAPFPLLMLLSRRFRQKPLLAFAVILMSASLVFSQSRGGMAAMLVQFTLVGVLVVRTGAQRITRVAPGVLAVVVAGFALWLGGELAYKRLVTLQAPLDDYSVSQRIEVARDSVPMFLARPVTGWGLGVFPQVYPVYRTKYDGKFMNQAHNDYLELLLDTGLVGFGIMIWFVVALFRSALPRLSQWSDSSGANVRAAALIGIAGILVHSVSDFNLHIPANAAMFFVLCALATVIIRPRSQRRRDGGNGNGARLRPAETHAWPEGGGRFPQESL